MRETRDEAHVEAPGTVHDVSDEGCVCVEYPGGRTERIHVPLEQVPRYRALLGRPWCRLPPLDLQ